MNDKQAVFKANVKEALGDEYVVLGEYINSNEDIKMKHLKCEHEYYAKPYNIVAGLKGGKSKPTRCPKCFGNKKTTEEDIKNKLLKETNGEFELVSKFKNLNDEVKILHKTCGRCFPVSCRGFLGNIRCKLCEKDKREESNRLKYEKEFKEYVDNNTDGTYEIKGKYIKSSKKIEMFHQDCSKRFLITPNKFKSGQRCSNPECKNKRISKSKLISHDEFMNNLQSVQGNNYEVLNEYNGTKNKLLVKHLKCNKIYETYADYLIKGRCKYCSNTYKRTTEEFIKELHEVWNDEFEVIGSYAGRFEEIEIKHNKEGCYDIFKTTPKSLLSGHGCAKCNNNKKLTQEEFEERVYQLYKGTFIVSGQYLSMKKPIKMVHVGCGGEITTKPDTVLRYLIACNNCPKTLGEARIKNVLDNFNLKYKYQYYFNDCRNIEPLRFDFGVLDDDENLIILVEYDGEYHEKDIRGTLEYIQHNDEIKNKYCEDNSIPLLRISYKDKYILEEILIDELSKYDELALY